jgi:ATP synthase protein I
MVDEKADDNSPDEFEEMVGGKEQRKLKSRAAGKQSPWFGLGMFGLVGWSIVLPMLLGIFVGAWIDQHWPSQVSWRLTLMFAGLVLGCVNAWMWIQKEANE